MVQFKFRSFQTPRLGFVYRPYAIVTLKYGSRFITDQFIVDAGADITMIPLWIGNTLKLPPPRRAEIVPIEGIGGSLHTVYRKVLLEIGKYNLEARVAWSQSDDVPLLLGRVDVFDFFKITFDQTDRVTTFMRKKKATRK